MDYSFHLENPMHHHLQNSSGDEEDKFAALFHLESNHIIPSNSIDSDTYFSIRLQIVSIINHLSSSFDPFLPYLSINYLDRFLSTQSIPERKPWMLRLIGISCLSLALKMTKPDFSASDIQNDEGGIIFDAQTIKKMELLILGALKWRMRSITPLAFVDFFISLVKFKDSHSCHSCHSLKDRATELIIKLAQHGLRCSDFKPSIVAASALLFACHELFPLQFLCFKNSISASSYVHKDDFYRCYNVIQEIEMVEHESALLDTLSSSTTPVNVLDLHYSSKETETESNTIVDLDTISESGTATETEEIRLERDLKKRRKITCFGTQNTFQLSQVQQC